MTRIESQTIQVVFPEFTNFMYRSMLQTGQQYDSLEKSTQQLTSPPRHWDHKKNPPTLECFLPKHDLLEPLSFYFYYQLHFPKLLKRHSLLHYTPQTKKKKQFPTKMSHTTQKSNICLLGSTSFEINCLLMGFFSLRHLWQGFKAEGRLYRMTTRGHPTLIHPN